MPQHIIGRVEGASYILGGVSCHQVITFEIEWQHEEATVEHPRGAIVQHFHRQWERLGDLLKFGKFAQEFRDQFASGAARRRWRPASLRCFEALFGEG